MCKQKHIAIYSPAASGSVGHGFDYAYELCSYLGKKHIITLYTIIDDQSNKEFSGLPISLMLSNRFNKGAIDKKRFLKFKPFNNIIYGLYRLRYNYILIKDFISRNSNCDLFHFFEFEYFAAFLYFFFHKKELQKTILGFHIADFKWIKDRSITVNIYKVILKRFVRFLILNSYKTTIHGEKLKEKLLSDIKVKATNNIPLVSIPYGLKLVDINYSKQEARKKLSLDLKSKYALFFGVLREDKGIIELIENFNKITPELQLIIAGSEGNISYKNIYELVERYQLENRIKLCLKYLTVDEMELYHLASDFIFIPHKQHHYAFSGPLSMAVQYKKPVIATNNGEIGYFVEKYQIGKVFKTNNFDDLAQVTNEFIKQQQFLKSFNFKKCQFENSWEMMATHISALYNS